MDSRLEIGLDDLNFTPELEDWIGVIVPFKWVMNQPGLRITPKIHPKAQPRVPYLAVLESRLETGLDDLNFFSDWRI